MYALPYCTMFPGKGKDLPKPFRKKTGPQLLPRTCVFSARRLPVQAGKTLLCPFLCCAAASGIFMVRQKPVGIVDPGIAQHLSVGYAGTAVLLGDGILHGGVAAGEGAVTSVGGVLVVLVIAGPVVLVAIVVVGVQDVLAGIHDVFASVLDILSDRVLALSGNPTAMPSSFWVR